MEIRCWRSIGMTFSKRVIPDNRLGEWLLERLFWLEERFPHALARVGRYAIIVIWKRTRKADWLRSVPHLSSAQGAGMADADGER
jgi:hypothetical protein